MYAQCLGKLCRRTCFLAYGNIDANYIFSFLIQNCIKSKCGFSCLPVLLLIHASMSSADRKHGINRNESGFKRNLYRLSVNYIRGGRSIGRYSSNGISPSPSMGTPREFTILPMKASPTGIPAVFLFSVRLPSHISLSSSKSIHQSSLRFIF